MKGQTITNALRTVAIEYRNRMNSEVYIENTQFFTEICAFAEMNFTFKIELSEDEDCECECHFIDSKGCDCDC